MVRGQGPDRLPGPCWKIPALPKSLKERVLEHLAVAKLKGGDMRGSILLLHGPPGVEPGEVLRVAGREPRHHRLDAERGRRERLQVPALQLHLRR